MIRLSNNTITIEKMFTNGAVSPNFKANSTVSHNVMTEIISMGSVPYEDENVTGEKFDYEDDEEFEEDYNDITIRTFNTESINNDDSLHSIEIN